MYSLTLDVKSVIAAPFDCGTGRAYGGLRSNQPDCVGFAIGYCNWLRHRFLVHFGCEPTSLVLSRCQRAFCQVAQRRVIKTRTGSSHVRGSRLGDGVLALTVIVSQVRSVLLTVIHLLFVAARA